VYIGGDDGMWDVSRFFYLDSEEEKYCPITKYTLSDDDDIANEIIPVDGDDLFNLFSMCGDNNDNICLTAEHNFTENTVFDIGLIAQNAWGTSSRGVKLSYNLADACDNQTITVNDDDYDPSADFDFVFEKRETYDERLT
jgi:hypothetical protein